jgi:predicted permease
VLTELASIVVPVYVCAGVGFVWVRTGRRFDTPLMTDLVFFVGAPCLTFSSLVSQSPDLGALADMLVAVAIATLALGGLAAVALRALGLPVGTYLAPMMFGNTGNMGLPLCYFAFGDAGLALGVCFFAATSLLQFTVGQAIWSGRASFGDVARSPLVWSVLIAFAVLALDVTVPQWVLRTTTLLGAFTIPLMQLTLGVSLAGLEVRSVGRSAGLGLLKIAGGAAVGLGVAHVMGLEGLARGVLVLQCAMPVAVFNYMFAVRYQRAPADVASLIVVSTLLALATTPALLALILP